MDPASETAAGIAFGRFRVVPHRRELFADGRPIKLGGRAFDVLMALIEARGAMVSKNALMRRVWTDRIVEKNSLQAQISALRAALGAECELIRTVSGRGYRFTGEIRMLPASLDAHADAGMAQPEAALPPTNLSQPISELIGRDGEVEEVLSLVGAHRLVTLTGAGGIGKTRLALAVARRLLPQFADGVWLAEFSPLADPGLVPATVAAAVGLDLGAGAVSPQRVAQALAERRLVLVLDTCEHVIAAAAVLAEAVLWAGPAVRILVTSREPLKAEGEWVYPVPPLAVPAANAEQEDPFKYGAIRLFLERVRAAEPRFAPDRPLVGLIAAICRRLDGIPLAIELAATRAAALGIETIAAHLDELFHLLTLGRRTALPRHQTLRATLDWSYALLTESEQTILRRLAIFRSGFRLAAANAVAASAETDPSEIVNAVAGLIAKSLVSVHLDGGIGGYRLLDTTRVYAFEKLVESGEVEWAARRHAQYHRALFERGDAEQERRPSADLIAEYGRRIVEVRAALDWAFSPVGDAEIGVALTAAYVPGWLHLSLLAECAERVGRALNSLETLGSLDAQLKMQLLIPFGDALHHSGEFVERTGTVLTEALDAAERSDDVVSQLRALWAMWSYRFDTGDNRAAERLADRFSQVARSGDDPADMLVGERLIGNTMHHSGNQARAQYHLERVVDLYVAPSDQRHTLSFHVDQRLLARATLARVLALRGLLDQAAHHAQASLSHARAADNKLAISYSLAEAACPIALMTGDLATAERSVAMLNDLMPMQGMTFYLSLGGCMEGELLIRRGDFAVGSAALRSALERRSTTGYRGRNTWFLGVLAEGLAGAGQLSEALAMIDDALAQSGRNGQHWCIAELCRVKGELLLQQAGDRSIAAAEDCMRAALATAREQNALFWELRAATSLARLLRDQGRSAEAMALLHPVYDRFTEGFDMADLKAAKALLDALAEPADVRTRGS